MAANGNTIPEKTLPHHCTMCCLGSLSSSQPNKLRHILKFLSWYPIQHIFVPACSIARNSYKKMFLWTSNSKSEIFSKMYPSVQWTLGYIFGMLTVYPTWATKYTPVSHIGGILDTGVHDCTMYTLCSGVLFSRGQCHTVTAQCSVFQDVHLRWNLSGWAAP